jgi:hypothetical protein
MLRLSTERQVQPTSTTFTSIALTQHPSFSTPQDSLQENNINSDASEQEFDS